MRHLSVLICIETDQKVECPFGHDFFSVFFENLAQRHSLGGPLPAFVAAYFGHPVTLPVLGFTEISTILLGMLGIGGLRTIEKVKGVA